MIDYNGYGNQQNTLLTNIHKNYKHTYKQYIYIYLKRVYIYKRKQKKGKKSKKKSKRKRKFKATVNENNEYRVKKGEAGRENRTS